jgi:poly(3-hydroxybutyrate) depolymerase
VRSIALLAAAVLVAGTMLVAAETPTPVKKSDYAEGFGPPAGGWPADVKPGYRRDNTVPGVDAPGAFDVWVPAGYTPDKAWPLVVVLHGGPGGRPIQMASIFAMGFAEKGAISVYPQALKPVLLEWNYPHEMAYVVRIVMQAAKMYHVDPCRLYLMGHSMGGGGAWAQGAVLRDVWAGIAPISGWYGANPPPKDEWLANMPIYCLHGDADQSVPVQRSRLAAEAMKKVGNKQFIYRELAGVGHQDILADRAKNGPELAKMADWLLAQKRRKPADLKAAGRALAEWGKTFHWSPEGGLLGSYADEQKPPPRTK